MFIINDKFNISDMFNIFNHLLAKIDVHLLNQKGNVNGYIRCMQGLISVSNLNLNADSLKRHATVSRNCRDDIELSNRKEDSNLKVEEILQPHNGCECNLRISSHTPDESITATVQDEEKTRVVSCKKFFFWKRTKNKIRENRMALFERKTAGDICKGGIFK